LSDHFNTEIGGQARSRQRWLILFSLDGKSLDSEDPCGSDVHRRHSCCRRAVPRAQLPAPSGYVPDAATAIRIAVAVWEPIYGAKNIASEKPFRAVLNKGVWTVTGSLPENTPGGVAVAEISMRDGKILRISHGK